MRAIIWDLCADLNRDLPRMIRRFCRLNYRGMHQRQNGAFSVLGQIPRAPNFAEFHARGGGGRLPVMPRDRIAPRGAHFSTAKRESRPRQSGCSAPRVCLGGGGGATFGRRAAATGGLAAHNGSVWAGQPSGVRAAHGGRKRARAGKKAAHAGTSGVPGVCAGAGVPGKTGASRVSIRAHAGQKTGGTGAKRGRSGGQKGGYGGRWGQKSPFLPRKRRATGLCWGENWLRKLAGRVGLFGAFREASGGFGGKS